MKRGTHSKSRFPKALALVLAMVLLVGAAIGGTIAWLTDKTDPVQNTFTPSNIGITLVETNADHSFKMIPGDTITKDPKVTVVEAKTDVDCYLYVKVEKSDNFADFMTYEMEAGWTELTGVANVYWREVKTTDTTKEFYVIKDNEVKVLDTVTKANMEALTTETYPTLTVTAYAVQTLGSTDAADAWTKVPTT